MIKAYSYARFSSTKQQKGTSIERQVQLAEEYAKKRGFDLDRTITYRDYGVSAFNGKNLERGALGAFLKAIENGTVSSGSYLLVESIDRISRGDLTTAQEIVKTIVGNGITIVTMFDGREYDRVALNDLGRLMILLSNMHLAHEESRKKSERSSASWQFARQKIGMRRVKTNVNHWLELSDCSSRYQVREGCKELINEVFDRYITGQGCNVIAKWLIAKRDTLYKWSPAVVCRLLKNRALLGEWQAFTFDHEKGVYLPATEVIPGYFPQVIECNKFRKVQHLLATRAKIVRGPVGNNVSNLFTGILRCAYCGSTIEMVNPGWSKKGHPVELKYVCRRARMGDCHLANWDVREFEDAFFSSAKEVAQMAKGMRNANAVANRLLSLKGEQDEISSKLSSLEVEIGKIQGSVSPILIRIIQGLEHEKQRVSNEIERLHGQLESEKQSDALRTITPPKGREERLWVANIIRQVVKRIDLFFVGDYDTLGSIMAYKARQIKGKKSLSGAIGYRIRREFSTDARRFFEVTLVEPGQGQRVRYPTTVIERSGNSYIMRRDYDGGGLAKVLDENDQATWHTIEDFESVMGLLEVDVSNMLGVTLESAGDLVRRFHEGTFHYMDLLRTGIGHEKTGAVLDRLRSSQVDLYQYSDPVR